MRKDLIKLFIQSIWRSF